MRQSHGTRCFHPVHATANDQQQSAISAIASSTDDVGIGRLEYQQRLQHSPQYSNTDTGTVALCAVVAVEPQQSHVPVAAGQSEHVDE